MKNTRNVLFALLLSGSVAGVASAQTAVSAGIHIGSSGRAAVDLGFFYDDLAPYGNWIERPSYGWVWTPSAVATSWRPYENGHWVWTDAGWTWITDEPYGWATYHYGRWYDDPEIGWSWVPGDTWGPSWVSWQEGSDYVGWAPLPPGVNVSVGFSSGYGGYAYGIAPQDYAFVPERNFLAPNVATYFVGPQDVGAIYGQTRNCTNYRFNGGQVFNQGVPIDHIQRFAGRVPQYQVADLGYGQGKSWRQPRFEGNRVAMFRPQIQKTGRIAPPIQRAAARQAVMSAAQFKAAHPNRAGFRQQMAQRQQFQNGNRQGVRGGQPFRTANQPQQLQKANRQQLQAAQRQQRQAQGQRQQLRGADLKRQQMAQRGQRQQQVAQQQRQGQRQQQHQQMAQRNQAQAWQKQARGQRQQQQFAQQRQQRQGAQRQQVAQRNQAQAWQKQQARQGQRQQWQGQRQQAQAAQRQQRQAAQRQQWQGQRQQAQAAQRQQWQAQRQQQRQAAQQQGQGPRNGGQGRGNSNRPPHGPGGR